MSACPHVFRAIIGEIKETLINTDMILSCRVCVCLVCVCVRARVRACMCVCVLIRAGDMLQKILCARKA